MNDEIKYPPIPMSQSHIASEFAKYVTGRWCYVHDYKRWFYLEGEEWKMDNKDAIKKIVVNFCNSAIYWPEAASLTTSEKRRITFYSYIGDILYLAKCHDKIATASEEIGLPPKKKDDRWRYPTSNPRARARTC
ncbi:hypothetical protein [Methylotenera sp.]|uniref:hypothetical protein n=1 Tax=Methylotenera sp. TaxID=2051956 RepID=UPI00273043DA|nr:hypothetical protein [Methylotenera sp.]MDP2230322.1 hypothetical protein [Methylotenera sp.]MDP3142301.1 hypothetical protein [Methylotenera sp.]